MERSYFYLPGSNMPAYDWMLKRVYEIESIPARIRGLMTLGVPYDTDFDQVALQHLKYRQTDAHQLNSRRFWGQGVCGKQVTADPAETCLLIELPTYSVLGIDIKGENKPWANLPDH